jgi:hypothetical protein
VRHQNQSVIQAKLRLRKQYSGTFATNPKVVQHLQASLRPIVRREIFEKAG